MEAPALGRVAALDAGLPVTASGIQLDRRCGSGLQAVLYAAMSVQTGAAGVAPGGGAGAVGKAPFYTHATRWGGQAGPGGVLQDGPGRRPGAPGGQVPP